MMTLYYDDDVRERDTERAMSDLIDGLDLPAHLDIEEARELITTLMVELYAKRRDFDRTPEQHNQTCCVFSRAAIERAAKRVAARITEPY